MKKNYLIFILALTTIFSYAQNYEFGIVHISDYDFKVVAIPDFNSAGNTDASDIGFALVLPTGSVDITNPVGLLTARTWTVQQFDAGFLSGLGLGDGTKDVFLFNLPPGQSVFAHTSGQQINLVSFQITNDPVSGQMNFLLNSDPIAAGAGGVLDSFYNSNIDATTTQDYFSAPNSSLDNFMFSTLTVEEAILDDNSISVYPNPTSDVIHINTSLQIEQIELYDITGKQVLTTSKVNNIKVNQLPAGVYLLKITTPKGQLTKKIIVE